MMRCPRNGRSRPRGGWRARDQVAARLATAEERRLLELTRPAAVLVYRLSVYDVADAPLQFDDATYPPDRWAFRQEYPLSR